MDDYLFRANVDRYRNVEEAMSYLEMSTYSDASLNTIEQHGLTDDEFGNFLQRRGAFAAPKLPEGVQHIASIRMILQLDAQHPDTFAPSVISLGAQQYKDMVESMKLPYRGIETTSVVGAFFWSAWDQDDETPHLQIIFRKSDVKKKGKTRGWELMLSHDIQTGITSGYAKGTKSSDMEDCIRHLKACAGQIGHPMLLPVIIFSHDISTATDIKQRDARDWLRRLENAVSMRTEIADRESYVSDGVVDLDAVNRDLVECHSQVLWKRPKAYLSILEVMETTMRMFQDHLPASRKTAVIHKLHRSMLGRIDFYRVKLHCLDSYAHTTLQRLDIQRHALYNIIAQKESKLNFQMAGEQRKLAHAAKRDSTAMKTISLLGTVFIPGAYVASIFSTTFFNFQASKESTVSDQFWIYWALTIPITMAVVAVWVFWDRRRERRYDREDADLEVGVEAMERLIMSNMRKRTMSKVSTWGQGGEIVKEKIVVKG